MKSLKTIFFLPGICILLLIRCSTMVPMERIESYRALIPAPHHITIDDDFFMLRTDAGIGVSEITRGIGHYLSNTLSRSTGFPFHVFTDEEKVQDINLILNPELTSAGEEGYKLEVDREGIRIMALEPAGLFYGCQTLLQLLPKEIYSPRIAANVMWKVPFASIQDKPRFTWRGAMLDVARHFFSVQDVKRFIGLMALHKLNRFHMHLSDDQGWRIQIKSRPNLALHGGNSQVGEGPGGYYTQEEFKEIINYARDRFIMVIPEIDMPGHTNAALSSYAELNKDGKATELYRGTKTGFSCLDVHSERVYEFINDVMMELTAFIPGPYIHIGGDEVETISTKDYIYFINRVQTIVQSFGKQLIGWEEICKADLSSTTIVQYWKYLSNTKEAVKKGIKTIVSPASKAYLDMKYNSSTPIGYDWAGMISVKDAYDWDPAVPGLDEKYILGIEAPLWTETVTIIQDIEYLAFPRLAGYAELGWSTQDRINWDDYRKRLAAHGERLNELGVNYYRSPLVSWYE